MAFGVDPGSLRFAGERGTLLLHFCQELCVSNRPPDQLRTGSLQSLIHGHRCVYWNYEWPIRIPREKREIGAQNPVLKWARTFLVHNIEPVAVAIKCYAYVRLHLSNDFGERCDTLSGWFRSTTREVPVRIRVYCRDVSDRSPVNLGSQDSCCAVPGVEDDAPFF